MRRPTVFDSRLSARASQVVNILIEKTGEPEDRVISEFMSSEVYDRLQDESTGVWHFSPVLLARLFEEEKEGLLEWPDVP